MKFSKEDWRTVIIGIIAGSLTTVIVRALLGW